MKFLFSFFLPVLPLSADITYTLQFDPNLNGSTQQLANSVAVAADFYNKHGSFNKHWGVYYNTGIPTAEANINGYMGYGTIFNERVVFHEAAHTFGMGTHGNYAGLIPSGVWTGQYGNQAQFDTYNDYGDGLHGDNWHAIWPGGFNFDNEDGFIERFWHTRIMAGIRSDMGILSYTREARNAAVVAGETAEFHVVSPLANSYQWYKNGVALTNGGDTSGANTATLRIANAQASDQGEYHCVANGAGESLACRRRNLWVHPAPRTGQWHFNGNTIDNINARNGVPAGSPTYATGKSGLAINLDGSDDYVDLPDDVSRLRNLTISMWVNWDGGGDWQRVFDFGSNTYQYLFLTPRSGGGDMRLALRDSINGKDQEYVVGTTALPTGTWVHLTAVINGDTMILYRDGRPVGTTFGITHAPSDFLRPTNNYVGKSQYPDPLFDGRIDDFQVHATALDGSDIWDLWGQSTNQAPQFTSSSITLPPSTAQVSYTGHSLASHVTDADDTALNFIKLAGPSWLTVSANGSLSGTPNFAPGYDDPLVVRVTDPSGATSDARITIPVFGTIGHWNFEEGSTNAAVPYAPANAGQYDGSITDISGNGNHLSAWDNNWHFYRSLVPSTTTPQTGAANTLSLQNGNGFPVFSAIGTSLTQWSPRAWTIEAVIRPDDATNGFQTFIGRDSQGAAGADPALASLYFGITPTGQLRIMFNDAAGTNWDLTSTANAVEDAKWQAVAATSDGSTLSLYLKNITDGDTAYTLLGTLDISSSSDPAISTGAGDGGDWDAGVFSFARGL